MTFVKDKLWRNGPLDEQEQEQEKLVVNVAEAAARTRPVPPVPPEQPVPPSPGHPLGRPPAHSPDSHSHPSPNPSHFTLPYLPVSREKYDLITTRRDTLITKLQLEKAQQQGHLYN